MRRTANQRSRRSHRLGGCENCRRRHTKCDQVRPKCLTCQAVGLECQGYKPAVKWITEEARSNIAAEAKSGTRQHLYSENTRISMTSQLLHQVEPSSLDNSLAEIDQWANSSQLQTSIKSIGPFSVMIISSDSVHSLSQSDHSIDLPNTGMLPVSTPSVSVMSAVLPDCLQWEDLFDLDFEEWLSQQPDDFGLNSSDELPQLSVSTPLTTLRSGSNQSSFIRIDTIDDNDLKKEASFLIRHFLDHVINAIAALPFHQKSPIKIMHVPAVVRTLSDLTYLSQSVKHANMANLYAVLASSSYHLGLNPSSIQAHDSDRWLDLANRASTKAKEHLHISLQTELSGENKAKYKDQLMALMSMLMYSITAGHKKEARRYMIDAERLLRVRGLAKKYISRRARLLHHMYTWIRIVGESTYVLHDYKHINEQSKLAPPNIQPGYNDSIDDFLRVDQRSVSEDPNMENLKDPDIGRQDIHLEDPRDDPNSMYLHIYGLPEQWLSLLSQTTRLANFSEISKHDLNLQRSLERRASRLEDMICNFASDSSIQATVEARAPARSMLQALNSALIIYFYRRIRNVNPLILQSHIDDVINALEKFDISLAQHQIDGPGTAWPAFIAGCEALPGVRRERLLEWIETAFSKTGFDYYKTAKEVMQEVWLSRNRSSNLPKSLRSTRVHRLTPVITWMEICKQKQEWVIVC